MHIFNIKVVIIVGIAAVVAAVVFIYFRDTTTYQMESNEETQARAASSVRKVIRNEREVGRTIAQKRDRNEGVATSRDQTQAQKNQDTLASSEQVVGDAPQEEKILAETTTDTIEMSPKQNEPEISQPQTEKTPQPPVSPTPVVEEETNISEEECAAFRANSAFFHSLDAVVVKKEIEYREKGNIQTADTLREISCFPQATWLVWKDAVSMRARVEEVTSAAEQVNKIPVFVIYNSPSHGNLQWWVGNQGDDYLNWIEEVAKGAGNRPAWFILEPDSIGLSTDYNESDREYRLNELKQAVTILKTYAQHARVYLDAGHSKWKTPQIFAGLLQEAGLAESDGFALNISNYQSLEEETERGEMISQLSGGKHFIIDTSRNGNGGPNDNEWCNARGRALGKRPTIDTGNDTIDAYFWIKPPGESDGTCNGGPTPGQFWIEYALELVENALRI